jgi:DNA gyrase/topoisomerase IV subunit B
MVAPKDNSARNLLITALFMVIIQCSTMVGLAVNGEKDRVEHQKADWVYKDYVPMWFLEGLNQNQNFMVEEIVAKLGGDKKMVHEITMKYAEFQTTMLNNFIQQRGGMTQITRGGYVTVTKTEPKKDE